MSVTWWWYTLAALLRSKCSFMGKFVGMEEEKLLVIASLSEFAVLDCISLNIVCVSHCLAISGMGADLEKSIYGSKTIKLIDDSRFIIFNWKIVH